MEIRPITVKDLYEEFMLHNEIKGLRERTIKAYKDNLKAFLDYLDEIGLEAVEDIKKEHYEQFILWLQERHSNTATINTYLRNTRVLLNFAMENHYLKDFKMVLLREDTKMPEIYTAEEIARLIRRPVNIKKIPFAEYRNWVLVCYLLETGNRLSTVVNIRVGDFDGDQGLVHLRWTKNRRESYAPLSPEMQKILRDYIRRFSLEEDEPLFPTVVAGQALSARGLQNAIAKHNKSRGVSKTSVHAFRHTFATNFAQSGGDALVLQRLLGHSSLKMTSRYVHMAATALTKGFQKHSVIAEYAKEVGCVRRRR